VKPRSVHHNQDLYPERSRGDRGGQARPPNATLFAVLKVVRYPVFHMVIVVRPDRRAARLGAVTIVGADGSAAGADPTEILAVHKNR